MQALLEKIVRKTAQVMDPGPRPAEGADLRALRKTDQAPEVPSLFLPYRFLDRDIMHQQCIFSNERNPIRHISDKRAYINWLYAGYYGLVCLNTFVGKGTASAHDEALRMADFLRSHCEAAGEAHVLKLHVDHPVYHLTAPWTSCLSQAAAALLNMRLHRYGMWPDGMNEAKKLITGMLLPVPSGGTARATPGGLPWLEEYPGEPPSYVLNGFLFGCIAILEYNRLGDNGFATEAQQLTESLLRCFPLYQYGRYLRYDRLYGTLCNPQYMGLHSLLLLHLYQLTGISQLNQSAQQVSRSTRWPLYFRSFGVAPDERQMVWLREHLG